MSYKNLFSLMALILIVSFGFAQGFEGVLTMNIVSTEDGKEDNTTVTLHLKNNQYMMDFSEMVVERPEEDMSEQPNGKMIFDIEKNEYIVMVDQGGQKMAMKYNMDKMKGYMDQFKQEDEEEEEKCSFSESGKEMLDGRSCIKYDVKCEESSGTMWLTTDIDVSLAEIMPFMQADEFADVYEAYPDALLVKAEGKEDDGSTFSMTVNIEEKAQEESLFQVDEGVQVMNMTMMMEQMMNSNPEMVKKMLEQMGGSDK